MEANIVKSNLFHVLQRIKNCVAVSKSRPNSLAVDEPRLVAVSKTFSGEFVRSCYDDGIEIIETFIDQNYEALDSFFREKLGRLRTRVQNRQMEAAESRQSKR